MRWPWLIGKVAVVLCSTKRALRPPRFNGRIARVIDANLPRRDFPEEKRRGRRDSFSASLAVHVAGKSGKLRTQRRGEENAFGVTVDARRKEKAEEVELGPS